jgi:hypothetical protein
MAGANIEQLIRQASASGVFDQPAQPVQQPVQNAYFVPAIQAQNAVPYSSPNFGAGVSQFLTGNMAIPMQFGVDIPAYEMPQYTPGNFVDFMNVQKQGTAENPVIPVYNPATGTYSAP